MVGGYKILWTNHALSELTDTYEYLRIHFTKRELKKLSIEIDGTLRLISQNPSVTRILFQKNIRAVILKKPARRKGFIQNLLIGLQQFCLVNIFSQQ